MISNFVAPSFVGRPGIIMTYEDMLPNPPATNDLRELIQKGVMRESGKKGAGAFYVIAQ